MRNHYKDMYSSYCQFCGHFLQDRYLTREERETKNYKPSKMSESWKKAYKNGVQGLNI